jgi:hypothetical protein
MAEKRNLKEDAVGNSEEKRENVCLQEIFGSPFKWFLAQNHTI